MKISKKSGFTLIELMVVMAIIGILAATAIVNFGKNEDRDVRQEKDRLTTFLREVQNKALAGEIPAKTLAPAGCYDASNKFTCNKICGYGIKSAGASSENLQAYFVYDTDINSNCTTNLASLTKNNLEVFYIQNGVTVSSPNDILFHVPDGKAYKDNTVLTTDGNVTISLTKGTSINTTIDFAGNIK